ncbi:MAG: PKD domain-containing protein [Thermoplasmatota archaeon]
MKRKVKIFIIAGISAVILVSVCIAALYAVFRYEPPETTVSSLELLGIDQEERTFLLGLDIQVFNPNNLKINIERLEGDVLIDDESVSPIFNRTGTEIPAKSAAEIRLVIIVDDSSMRVLTGERLTIRGRSYGSYLWVDGSSDFEETMDLPGPGNGPIGLPPIAVIEAPLTGTVLEEIEFDGSLSRDPDGEVGSYEWDFGDGSADSGEVVQHRFTAPGLYSVELLVQDNDGNQDRAVHQITIRIGL